MKDDVRADRASARASPSNVPSACGRRTEFDPDAEQFTSSSRKRPRMAARPSEHLQRLALHPSSSELSQYTWRTRSKHRSNSRILLIHRYDGKYDRGMAVI